MPFKKIVGNYKEVTDCLGLDESNYEKCADAFDVLKKDLSRTRRFNVSLERLESEFRKLEQSSTSYSQGDLDGGVFSEFAFQKSRFSSIGTYPTGGKLTLRFSYLNDYNQVSAFSITYVKSAKSYQNKYFFNIAIIQDVFAQLSDKEGRKDKDITFISHPELLPDQKKHPSRNNTPYQDVSSDDVVREVLAKLKCKSFEKHIERLCKGTADSFMYAAALAPCFKSKKTAGLEAFDDVSKLPVYTEPEPPSMVENMLSFAQEHPLLTAGIVGLLVASMVLVTAATCGAATMPVGLAVGLGLFSAGATYGATQYTGEDDDLKSNINS